MVVGERLIGQKSIRKQNKEKIFNFLNDAYPNGKSISELVNYTRSDPDTIYVHLKTLMKERKVEKIRVKGKDHWIEYRATDSYQVSKEGKARIMRPMGKKMICYIWQTPEIIDNVPTYDSLQNIDTDRDANGNIIRGPTLDELGDLHDKHSSMIYGRTEPEHEFYESMIRNDVTISNKFCQTKFAGAEKERHMFDFVNRVGAFITYIFIEALGEKSGADNTKTPIAKLIIDNAIDLNGIFREFQNLCLSLKVNPEEISEAFRRVYPTAEILEKYWSDRAQLSERVKKEQARAERERRTKILKGIKNKDNNSTLIN